MFDKFEIVETTDKDFDIVVTYGQTVTFYAVGLKSIHQCVELIAKEGLTEIPMSIVSGSYRFEYVK